MIPDTAHLPSLHPCCPARGVALLPGNFRDLDYGGTERRVAVMHSMKTPQRDSLAPTRLGLQVDPD